MADVAVHDRSGPADPTLAVRLLRFCAWGNLTFLTAFLINCYLSFWRGWPSAQPVLRDAASAGFLSWLQFLIYVAAIVGALAVSLTAGRRAMRTDAAWMTEFSAFIIRACFWGVLLIGLVDMAISFLRVEDLLPGVVGNDLAEKLGRPVFRGTYVQVPLMGLGIVIAVFNRGLGFTWLALLVVIAELQIVISRFVFSYEQAFMGDLVRFWYAALFLFASAYTLLEEGHVRVDVLYAGFSRKTKGLVNVIGSVVLGIVFCWVIIIIGMWTKTSIIISAVVNFEVSQSGFGMYVKYLMAGFLGVFAITMMVQFTSQLLDSAAEYRGDSGGRDVDAAGDHS